MGSWGDGNLENDGASHILYEYSKALVEETLTLARSKLASEYDEYECDKLFVNLEILFALARGHLLRYHPEPGEVTDLKHSYLAAYDAYAKKNGMEDNERRAVIVRTFDRLIWISLKEKRRVELLPQWVEIPRPTIAELGDDLSFSPHLVLGEFHLSLPASWNAETWSGPPLPESTLARNLMEDGTGLYVVQEHRFTLDRVFFASGPSLDREHSAPEDCPYLLLARLRILDDGGMPEVYPLVRGTVEILSLHFQGQGEHVGGVVCLETPEAFSFDGLESFRHIKPGPDWGTRLRHKDLYYHRLSEQSLLLLEVGSVRDNVDRHFPDAILLDHIVDSMRAASNPGRSK